MTATYVSLIDLADCDKGTRFFFQDGCYYYKTRTESDAWKSKDEIETNKEAFTIAAKSFATSPAINGKNKAANSTVFNKEDFLREYEASNCSVLMSIVYWIFPACFYRMCKRKQDRFKKVMLYKTLINTRFDYQ